MGAVGVLRTAAARVRQRPGLLVPAVLALILNPVGPLLGLGILALVQFGPVERVSVLLLAGLVYQIAILTVVRPAILPSLVELTKVERQGGGLRDGVATLRRTWNRDYSDLFIAGGVGRGVAVVLAIPLTLLLGLVALPVGTAFEVGLYALDLLDSPEWQQIMGAVVLVPLLASLLALYLTGFAELFALDGESGTTAYLASLRNVRTKPLPVASYAVLRGIILASPFLPLGLAYRLGVGGSGTLWLLFGAGMVLSIPARALDEAFRVHFYEDVLTVDGAPVVAAERMRDVISRPSVPSGTVVLAALLLVAAAVGAGVVRVTDARPNPEPGGPPMLEEGSPSELYERAIARTTGVDRNVTVKLYGYVEENATLARRLSYYHDLSDRQFSIHFYTNENGSELAGITYVDDGINRANYYVPFPRTMVEDTLQPDTPWRVVRRTEEYLVLGIDAPSELMRIHEYPDPEHADYGPRSRVRVWIRTDTQRLSKISYRRQYSYGEEGHSNDSGYDDDLRLDIEFGYEDTDVRRPPSAEKGVGAYVWDLLYY